MEIIEIFICVFISLYFIIAIGMTLMFTFGNFKITATIQKDNVKKELKGIKKFIACFIISLIWPYILSKNDENI